MSPVTGVPLYMDQKTWLGMIASENLYNLTAEGLHIPQWIARPAGTYIAPFFKSIHKHILLRVPRGVSKVLRIICGDLSVAITFFQLLLLFRSDFEFLQLNPFVNESGLIILNDQRYFIPRRPRTIFLDRILKLPFVMMYEITDPWVTAAAFDQLFRWGDGIKKIKLTRSVNKRGSYVIAGGKKFRAPGYAASYLGDPEERLKDWILEASSFLLRVIGERRLRVFGWWV